MTEKMIEVSKVVEVARRLAEKHDWCDVVEQALVEMGAVEENLWSGTITIEVPIKNFKLSDTNASNPVDWFNKNAEIFASIETDADDGEYQIVEENSLKAVAANLSKAKSDDENWAYTSVEGRVLHHFPNGTVSTGWYGSVISSCGVVIYGNAVKTSSRGENRKCARCEKKAA